MGEKVVKTIKAMTAAYIFTVILIVIVSFIMYKLRLTQAQSAVGVLIIYALSTALGGFLLSHSIKSRRLLCGAVVGAAYFLVLLIVSVIVNRGIFTDASECIRAALVCVVGGIIGGIAG